MPIIKITVTGRNEVDWIGFNNDSTVMWEGEMSNFTLGGVMDDPFLLQLDELMRDPFALCIGIGKVTYHGTIKKPVLGIVFSRWKLNTRVGTPAYHLEGYCG